MLGVCYSNRKFMYLGQLVATSVIQAKATYPFLSKGMFQLYCGKRIDEIDYTVVDVANVEARAIIEKVSYLSCNMDF